MFTVIVQLLSDVRCLHRLFKTGCIQPHWRCQEWWRAIKAVLLSRQRPHSQPLEVTWIPAHKCESREIWQIHPQEAQDAGTTLEHVLRNRQADQAAKALANRIASRFQESSTAPSDVACATSLPFIDEVDRATFPKWPWNVVRSEFSWRPKIPNNLGASAKWNYTSQDWKVFCQFARSLRWWQGPEDSVAFCELAVFSITLA